MNSYDNEQLQRQEPASSKPKILCFCPWYLPGFKGGGPIVSISSLVAELGDYFDFLIVTRDRDFGDNQPYTTVEAGNWQGSENSKVIYLSPKMLSIFKIANLLRNTEHDLIYLNSFFDKNFSIIPQLANLIRFRQRSPVLLAPRGEFSPGALQIKRLKKLVFIKFWSLVPLIRRCAWHSTSSTERDDIISATSLRSAEIFEASMIPKKVVIRSTLPTLNPEEPIRIVFMSRISAKKNLKFAITSLRLLEIDAEFSIFGPIEDGKYWEECVREIQKMPENVSVVYRGALHPSSVHQELSKHDIFYFPTLGENYGHVIVEAMQAGLPLVLSDQTPWRNLKEKGLGLDASLAEPETFIQFITDYALLPIEKKLQYRMRQARKVEQELKISETILNNYKMFMKYAITRHNCKS